MKNVGKFLILFIAHYLVFTVGVLLLSLLLVVVLKVEVLAILVGILTSGWVDYAVGIIAAAFGACVCNWISNKMNAFKSLMIFGIVLIVLNLFAGIINVISNSAVAFNLANIFVSIFYVIEGRNGQVRENLRRKKKQSGTRYLIEDENGMLVSISADKLHEYNKGQAKPDLQLQERIKQKLMSELNRVNTESKPENECNIDGK